MGPPLFAYMLLLGELRARLQLFRFTVNTFTSSRRECLTTGRPEKCVLKEEMSLWSCWSLVPDWLCALTLINELVSVISIGFFGLLYACECYSDARQLANIRGTRPITHMCEVASSYFSLNLGNALMVTMLILPLPTFVIGVTGGVLILIGLLFGSCFDSCRKRPAPPWVVEQQQIAQAVALNIQETARAKALQEATSKAVQELVPVPPPLQNIILGY